MKIVCPSCDAAYEVPEKVATSRRKMRCARCATEWVPADSLRPAVEEEAAALTDVPVAAAASQEVTAEHVPVPLPQEAPMAPAQALPEDAEPLHEPPEPEAAMELPLTALVVVPPRPVTVRQEPGPRAPEGHSTSFTQRGVPPSEKGPPLLAWGGSIAVLAAAVVAALVFRAPLMKAWPPSMRLYAAIGLTSADGGR